MPAVSRNARAGGMTVLAGLACPEADTTKPTLPCRTPPYEDSTDLAAHLEKIHGYDTERAIATAAEIEAAPPEAAAERGGCARDGHNHEGSQRCGGASSTRE